MVTEKERLIKKWGFDKPITIADINDPKVKKALATICEPQEYKDIKI